MTKKYSIDQVFELIGEKDLMIQTTPHKKENIVVDGHRVYRQSLRYATFYQKGTKCCCCGKEGAYFQLDADRNATVDTVRRHFNLYAEDGTLMTKDHIRPKKWGGEDHIDNLQTMCVDCNKEKGSCYEFPVLGIVGIPINENRNRIEFIDKKQAIYHIVNNLLHLVGSKRKPGTLCKSVIDITLKFENNILDAEEPYCGYIWKTEEIVFKGSSYSELKGITQDDN